MFALPEDRSKIIVQKSGELFGMDAKVVCVGDLRMDNLGDVMIVTNIIKAFDDPTGAWKTVDLVCSDDISYFYNSFYDLARDFVLISRALC
jgi:hypothetical protein